MTIGFVLEKKKENQTFCSFSSFHVFLSSNMGKEEKRSEFMGWFFFFFPMFAVAKPLNEIKIKNSK